GSSARIEGGFGGPGTIAGGTSPLTPKAPGGPGGPGLAPALLGGAGPSPPLFPGSFRGFEAALRSLVATDLALGKIDRAVLRTDQLLQSQYERYYGRRIQARSPQSADDLRSVLSEVSGQTGTKPAIVYFVFQPDRLEIAVLAPGIKSFYRSVPIERKLLLQQVATFREQITNPTNQNYLPSAQKLYNLLFAPIAPLLAEQGIDTLLVVPDSGLRSLPFVALHDGQKFLVEKWSVSLIPSISLTDIRYNSLRKATVLAMGASIFRDLSPLPAVPVELESVVKELGQGQSLLNQAFTVENLKTSRQKQAYSIVHLATHGEFRSGTSRNSYIQFWDRKLNLRDLGLLQLDQPPVELLVLSACRTALGDEQAEFGFGGLAVQAGVRSALASLWYVSDTGTLGLMTEFYSQLRLQATKAGALRAAQIAMIRGKIRLENQSLIHVRGSILLKPELLTGGQSDLTHPYYWAAFTLIGSPW
ncbi:MAG: CHAT domain-containing protein, partial [Leptolyngbyaceae cyanobacterium bins.59]|nr:CHAT domain-containing protein [Leptolyngbyaceae cyanobacterium bins.59]